MRIAHYVDGFNLYYRALKGTADKWLDVVALCQLLKPTETVASVRYFTARIKPLPNDPSQATRQQVYLRALATVKGLEIHFGSFLEKTRTRPLAQPGKPKFVRVQDREEKGSDVNLASYLVLDAARESADHYAVISNDSDLVTPVELVRSELGQQVTIWTPEREHPSSGLKRAVPSGQFRIIRKNTYAKAQLPPTLTDPNGTITKPKSW